MKKKILITGASGLLGRSLVRVFLENGYSVLAQYHTNQLERQENCYWLRADFSNLSGIREFIHNHRDLLKNCSYLINNYGPITSKPFIELSSEDLYFDFHHNVITAFEMTTHMVKQGSLKSVINVGFEFMGYQRLYRKIVSYASAKNTMLLMTKSFQDSYSHVKFHIYSTPTLKGAKIQPKNSKEVPPDLVAKDIYHLLIS